MHKKPGIAEIKLDAQGISLYGHVSRMSREEIAIRLLTLPSRHIPLPAGLKTEMTIVAGETYHKVNARVAVLQGDTLTLTMGQEVLAVQRRRAKRYPCEISVAFRTIHAESCLGAWCHASAVDMSEAGLALLIERGWDIPGRMELLFRLSNDPPGVRTLRSYSDNGLEIVGNAESDQPFKVKAQTRQVRPHAGSKCRIGVSFLHVSPMDQIRLSRFVIEELAARSGLPAAR